MRILFVLLIITTGPTALAGSIDSVVNDLFYNSLSNLGSTDNTKKALGSAQKAFAIQNLKQEKDVVTKKANHLLNAGENWARNNISEDMQRNITVIILATKVIADRAVQFRVAHDMNMKIGLQEFSFNYNF